MKSGRFASEAQLAQLGRAIIKGALKGIHKHARAQFEVQAPGAVPDAVIYFERGKSVEYVVTVEFKLADWRRALEQAFRHRNFGNEAYVVMDAARSAPARAHLELFRRANVGLVTINTHGDTSVSYYPTPGLPFSREISAELGKTLRRSPISEVRFARTARGGVALAQLRSILGSPSDLHRE